MRTTTNKPITSLAMFRRRAERGIRAANPDATDLTIAWNWSRKVTYPTGLKGYAGEVTLTAPGYRPTTRIASYAEGVGLTV
jgi:hypothetical protein